MGEHLTIVIEADLSQLGGRDSVLGAARQRRRGGKLRQSGRAVSAVETPVEIEIRRSICQAGDSDCHRTSGGGRRKLSLRVEREVTFGDRGRRSGFSRGQVLTRNGNVVAPRVGASLGQVHP